MTARHSPSTTSVSRELLAPKRISEMLIPWVVSARRSTASFMTSMRRATPPPVWEARQAMKFGW